MTSTDAKISAGILRGETLDGVARFFGIPYAAAEALLVRAFLGAVLGR